jgi:RNA-splicing ligase RtcB
MIKRIVISVRRRRSFKNLSAKRWREEIPEALGIFSPGRAKGIGAFCLKEIGKKAAEKAMELTFGSTAHGAGRMMSRSAAKRKYWGGDVKTALEKRGIVVRAASAAVLAEEADPAYKNVDVVAEVSDQIGIAVKVARLVPIAVVKG